ncbi:MAG: hypothetical protein K0S70_225 [Microbacterium sp.]|nr:hypothetical protein [Microbacterium sp.]
MITVKYGDTHTIAWAVNADLSGATVRLLFRKVGATESVEAGGTVTDAPNGVVTHTLTGTLPIGHYDVEVEATKSGAVTTAPSVGYERLVVARDLG